MSSEPLETPLHLATEVGSCRLAKMLLDHGADLDARYSNGFTPLFFASALDSMGAFVPLLQKGSDSFS